MKKKIPLSLLHLLFVVSLVLLLRARFGSKNSNFDDRDDDDDDENEEEEQKTKDDKNNERPPTMASSFLFFFLLSLESLSPLSSLSLSAGFSSYFPERDSREKNTRERDSRERLERESKNAQNASSLRRA